MTAFPPATRRVGRLRLCAPSHDQARRAATLFENALRTASLPDAGHGRLILIRRLNLGRIHPRAGAASFALRLEEVARAAVLRAVPADSAAAVTADAVCFRDCAEALAMFARRLARRVPASEWFWPAALPGWRAGLDRSAQWFALLRIAESLPASTLAAATLVREANRGGCARGVDGGSACGRRQALAANLGLLRELFQAQ